METNENEDGMSYWHHRTIRHINSKYPFDETETYLTAHEFSYTGAEYDGFSFSQAVSMSKQEANWISEAYDLPPVLEVDDADMEEDEYGFPNYKKYVWLDKKVLKGDQNGND